MCVIMAIDGTRPTPEMIKKAWERNDDGGGLAYRETDGEGKVWVKWEKNLSLEQMETAINTLPMPFIAHFRTASSGGVRPELCHPFEVSLDTSRKLSGKTDGYVFFHNGDWQIWREVMLKAVLRLGHPIPHGKWSDSRAMAFLMSMYGPNFIDIIDQKGVAYSPDDIEFFAGTGWKEINKVWCSNDHFWGGVRTSGTCKEIGCFVRNGIDADGKCSTHRKRQPVDPTLSTDEQESEEDVRKALLRMHDHPATVKQLPAGKSGSGGNRGDNPFPPQVVALMEVGNQKQALWVAERMHEKDKKKISKNLLKKLRVMVTGVSLSPCMEELYPKAYASGALAKKERALLETPVTVH